MMRRIVQTVVIVTLLVTLFVSAGDVSAGYGCASSIIVQWGDTLSGIAANCGTTVDAIRSANPGLGWWVYAGQSLSIPGGSSTPGNYPSSGGTYTVQSGDTLGKIAARSNTSVSALLAVNPQIVNASLIYAGQVIHLPAGVSVPTTPSNPGTPSTPTDSYSKLEITYTHGLFIRAAPNGTILASALYKDVLLYRANSVYTDDKCRVWVEVRLFKKTKGYYTGWILVKDQLGGYFTKPNISN